MKPPVRIAVLGAGLIGHRHIAEIRACREAVLHAIVDPSDAARDLAAKDGTSWFPDFSAMLAAGKPDGVIVATPNQLHCEHGLAAIAAGIPALVEKPLTDTVAAGRRLVEAAEAASVPLLTGHHRRHNPIIARAKAIMDSGRLGRLVSVHAFFWLMKPDDYFDIPWRRAPGAGPVLVNLIHDIDLLRHLVGEIEAVQAFQSNAVRANPVDETTVLNLRFANGALGTINVSDTIVAPWSWEHTSRDNPAFPHGEQTFLHIGGTHGSLAVPGLEVWSNRERRSWLEPFSVTREIAPIADPYALQVMQFVRVICGEEAPLVSGREGLRTLAVIDAVQRAAASGVTVRIDA